MINASDFSESQKVEFSWFFTKPQLASLLLRWGLNALTNRHPSLLLRTLLHYRTKVFTLCRTLCQEFFQSLFKNLVD